MWPRCAAFASCLFALVAVTTGALGEDTNRQILVTEQLPKPDHIWVYNFAATPAEVPAGSGIAGQYVEPATPPTAEQVAEGQKIGADIAAALVEQITKLKLPAELATAETKPAVNDIVVRGYLLSMEEDQSIVLGLGSKKSDLTVAVEGYQMTAQGLRKLGSGTAEADGNKRPGMAAPLASAIVKGNPLGLIVKGGKKIKDAKSGIDERVKPIVEEIIKELKPRFEQQGWIEKKKGLF